MRVKAGSRPAAASVPFCTQVHSRRRVLFPGYRTLRGILDGPDFVGREKPLLAGPDVALQRHSELADAVAGRDPTIIDKLAWVANFTAAVGDTLDVVSWHTYDFHASDVGTADHTPLDPGNANTSRLWNTRYLDEALRLASNVSQLRDSHAPRAPVWLTETDSVCHQGVYNDTNAFLNSLWLVNRLGAMASQGYPVMNRQSLVGYNYSLLGNWPLEEIKPNPDFFTTVLWQQLVGDRHIDATVSPVGEARAAAGQRGVMEAPGDAVRSYAFCTRGLAGAVTMTHVNFQPADSAQFHLELPGPRNDYLLTPGGIAAAGEYPFTSRQIALNGRLLAMGTGGTLPDLGPVSAPPQSNITLPPLSVAFSVFPQAAHPACL